MQLIKDFYHLYNKESIYYYLKFTSPLNLLIDYCLKSLYHEKTTTLNRCSII
jgi:hypothetical protein